MMPVRSKDRPGRELLIVAVGYTVAIAMCAAPFVVVAAVVWLVRR